MAPPSLSLRMAMRFGMSRSRSRALSIRARSAREATEGQRQSVRAEERAARRREQRDAARRPELGSEQDPEAIPDPRRRRAGRADQSPLAGRAGRAPPLYPRRTGKRADRVAAKAVQAGGGIEAVIEATGFRTRENIFRLINPTILEHAERNDDAHASADETAGER